MLASLFGSRLSALGSRSPLFLSLLFLIQTSSLTQAVFPAATLGVFAYLVQILWVFAISNVRFFGLARRKRAFVPGGGQSSPFYCLRNVRPLINAAQDTSYMIVSRYRCPRIIIVCAFLTVLSDGDHCIRTAQGAAGYRWEDGAHAIRSSPVL